MPECLGKAKYQHGAKSGRSDRAERWGPISTIASWSLPWLRHRGRTLSHAARCSNGRPRLLSPADSVYLSDRPHPPSLKIAALLRTPSRSGAVPEKGNHTERHSRHAAPAILSPNPKICFAALIVGSPTKRYRSGRINCLVSVPDPRFTGRQVRLCR